MENQTEFRHILCQGHSCVQTPASSLLHQSRYTHLMLKQDSIIFYWREKTKQFLFLNFCLSGFSPFWLPLYLYLILTTLGISTVLCLVVGVAEPSPASPDFLTTFGLDVILLAVWGLPVPFLCSCGLEEPALRLSRGLLEPFILLGCCSMSMGLSGRRPMSPQ